MAQARRKEGLFARVRLSYISNWRVALLLLLAGILSAASIERTFQGMLSYLAPKSSELDLLTLTITLFITLGLQGLMLVSAWLFGKAVVRGLGSDRSWGARLRWLGSLALALVIFSCTMTIAVFFSYNAFYRSITSFAGGEEARAGKAREAGRSADLTARGNRSIYMDRLAQDYVQNKVNETLTRMRTDAEAQRERYHQALTQSPPPDSLKGWLDDRPAVAAAGKAWPGFRDRMNETIVFAEQSQPRILRLADKLAEEKRARDVAEKERLGEINAARAQAQLQLNRAQADESRLVDAIKAKELALRDADKKIDGLSNDIRMAANRMECELKGRQCEGAPPTNPGRGPRYAAAKAEHDDKQLQRSQAERDRQDIADKLNDDRKALDAAVARKTEASRTIGVETAKLPGPGRGNAVLSASLTGDELASEVDRMKAALRSLLSSPAAFGMPVEQPAAGAKSGPSKGEGSPPPAAAKTNAALLQLEGSCSRILKHLSNEAFATAKKAQEMSCARDGLAAGIAPIQDLNAGLEAFDAKSCRTLGSQFRQANTTRLIQRGYECLETVRLDGDRADAARQVLAELERKHNKDVHPFVQSLAGLTDYGDSLAYLSLGIAGTLDMLIFFTGLLGAAAGLRRMDRLGEDEGAEDILGRLDAVSPDRTTLLRSFLKKVNPQPHQFTRDGPIYSGYISACDLLDDAEQSGEVRQALLSLSRSKRGIPLIVQWPKADAGEESRDDGLAGVRTADPEPVRYFILQNVIDDMMDDLKSREKASPAEQGDLIKPPRDPGSRRAGWRRPDAGGRWSSTRTAESRPSPVADQDHPESRIGFHDGARNGASPGGGPQAGEDPPDGSPSPA